jgi:hypothetical protein
MEHCSRHLGQYGQTLAASIHVNNVGQVQHHLLTTSTHCQDLEPFEVKPQPFACIAQLNTAFLGNVGWPCAVTHFVPYASTTIV